MVRYISLLLFIGLAFWGCEEDEPEDCAGVAGGDNICGCTDSTATNYDSTATFDDESCEYDTTPPIVTITSPQDGSTVSEVVSITCLSTDNEGVEKVELWVDGVSTNVTDNTEPYSLDWNTRNYVNSSYTISIRSYDTNENKTDSDPINLIVYNLDITPPTVTITSPQDGSTISDSVTITCLSTDNEGVEKVELWVNGLSTGLTDNSEPYSFEWNIMAVENGLYTIVVRSYDLSGNTTDSEPITLIVDNFIRFVNAFITADDDVAYTVRQTIDNGFIYACLSSPLNGQGTTWLVKTNEQGINEWQTEYSGFVDSYSPIQTVYQVDDGGYFLFGNTFSGGGTGIKIDSNGNEEWRITRNGVVVSGNLTTDGGYIITGQMWVATEPDLWLHKIDNTGNTEWDKFYGGDYLERGNSVEQTSDGGYIVVGVKNYCASGCSDGWLVKTDSEGNEEWNNSYDGDNSSSDSLFCVQQTLDGGFITVGTTWNGNTDPDLWLLKTDNEGNELWRKNFGGSGKDFGRYVKEIDDGYIITGITESFGNGGEDIYLIKTDSEGNEIWSKSHGGSLNDGGNCVQNTNDGGYVISGYADGSPGTANIMFRDAVLIKTDPEGNTIPWSD